MRALILSAVLACPLALAAKPAAPAPSTATPADEVAGFANARWGMTPDEVGAAENIDKDIVEVLARTGKPLLLRQAEIAGGTASVRYEFEEGRLVQVRVTFGGRDAATSRHAALKKVLIEKYGKSADTTARAGLDKVSHWKRAKTTVTLTLTENEVAPEKQVVQIVYRDATKPLPRNDIPDKSWGEQL